MKYEEEPKASAEPESLHQKVDALGKYLVSTNDELLSLLRSELAGIHHKLNALQKHVK